MISTARILAVIGLVMVLPLSALAQKDQFGEVDTVWAELTKIDDYQWSINLSYFNDEPIIGMSIPLKISSGFNRIVADSCIYKGGRVEHFDYHAFRADTAIQCVTLGMIAALSASKRDLAPGKGRLATIFVSSIENKPVEQLTVDTTTTSPNNSLEVIAAGIPPGAADTTAKSVLMQQRTIVPAFVVISPEQTE